MSIDVVVVLCGGAGERLWPASHVHRPKPLIPVGGTTLLAATVDRFRGSARRILLVCGAEHADAMCAAAPGAERFVESERRGTGPAVVAGARWAAASCGPDAVVLVTPADHFVADEAALLRAITRGIPAARSGDLVTFGVVPDRPHPGYGYVGPGVAIADGVYRISRFSEKPDVETAARLVRDGFLWNSGLFLFSARGLEDEIARCAPGLGAASPEAGSFDVLVMERTTRGAVVPVACGWSDVGTWPALAQRFPSGPPGQFVWSEGVEVQIDGLTGVGVAASPRGVRVFRLEEGGPRGDISPPSSAATSEGGPPAARGPGSGSTPG